jgi:hypothetical protein
MRLGNILISIIRKHRLSLSLYGSIVQEAFNGKAIIDIFCHWQILHHSSTNKRTDNKYNMRQQSGMNLLIIYLLIEYFFCQLRS